MRTSDLIAQFIQDMINTTGGLAEIGRNELAIKFNVAPSQINYVLASRFTPEQGYIIESRRGGGGYIKIHRIKLDKNNYIMHIVNSLGESLDCETANIFLKNMLQNSLIEPHTAKLISSAMRDTNYQGLTTEAKNIIRARIFKVMLMTSI
jgi:transcriptional regulator CtsR